MRTTKRRILRASLATVAMTALTGGLLATAAPGQDLSVLGGANRLDGDQTKAIKQAVIGGKARNVILLIGDGMGDSEITIARNYAEGAAGRFAGIDALPLTGQYTTYSLDKATGKPDYDPESASTASAWATGVKTYDGALSVNLKGKAQKTLLQLAKAKGLRTGNVSTAEIQDATPAAQIANISARGCYGPSATLKTCPEAALENGGLGSITEQLIKNRPDVTLGGGATTFDEVATGGDYKGKTLKQQAFERGYQIVNDKAGLNGIKRANQAKPLLGLFAPGNMAVRWVGPEATADGGKKAPVTCTPNPDRKADQPTLADMTSKAIELLNTKRNGPGFFLQVEGASIDKQNHGANACGQIGETVDLDEAVKAALDFAAKDGNTSVFVTADHAHTSQIVEAGSVTTGSTVTLLTADDAPLTISYATAPKGSSQQHTGSQLRIAGYGPGAANIVGLTDQTDLNTTIRRILGLNKRGN